MPARWTNATILRGWTTVILAGAVLLVGCDRTGERAAPTASAPVGGPRADLTVQTSVDANWSQLADLLLLTNTVLALNDPPAAAEELHGLGQKFQLFFTMMDDSDPQNLTNGDVSDFTTPAVPAGFAIAFRNLPPGIKITALRDELGFKYFFVGRSCAGGSPRVTLLVDADGDGKFDQSSGDFAAHGHPNPFVGCPMNTWVYENLTDIGPRWEVTPGGAVSGIPVFAFSPWSVLEAAVMAQFPNHKILAGFLVDDSCSFQPPSCGEAHYDLVTVENRTLENRQDTVRK